MDVRSVYRWESPLATTKWLAIYTYLWHTQHLVGFIVSLNHLAVCSWTEPLDLVRVYHLHRPQTPILPLIRRIFAGVDTPQP